jgi:hypothetical protein
VAIALLSLLSPAHGLSNSTTNSFSNGTTTASRTSSRSSIVSTQSSSLASSNGTTSRMPLPSLATILTGTVGSQVVTETYVPHIFQDYTTLSKEVTTTTILTAGGDPVTVVIGPGGVGYVDKVPFHIEHFGADFFIDGHPFTSLRMPLSYLRRLPCPQQA